MKVLVRYFASVRDYTGKDGEMRELGDGMTLGDLLTILRSMYNLDSYVLTAVNMEYVGLDTILHEGDTVALFPPVSGG